MSPSSASRLPPNGLRPEQCPQFLVVGCDDNQHADGVEWVLETFAGKRNPDGAPVRISFYTTPTREDDPSQTVGPDVVAAWRKAHLAGHETANHAFSHAHGAAFTVEEWMGEIKRCGDFICAGAGIPREAIVGFRAPFLEPNDNAFAAAAKSGMLYDTSLQLGWDEPGNDNRWPFAFASGLWELPVDPAHFPADLGLGNTQATGFDWNLWFPGGGVTRPQFAAILRHTLDLKYRGNRAPMNLGLHAYIYSEAWAGTHPGGPRCGIAERKEAVREFLDYALGLPDVRVVSGLQLVEWLRKPVPLR